MGIFGDIRYNSQKFDPAHSQLPIFPEARVYTVESNKHKIRLTDDGDHVSYRAPKELISQSLKDKFEAERPADAKPSEFIKHGKLRLSYSLREGRILEAVYDQAPPAIFEQTVPHEEDILSARHLLYAFGPDQSDSRYPTNAFRQDLPASVEPPRQ